MENDLGVSLRDIQRTQQRSLIECMLEIQQKHKATNHKSVEFIENLKCFYLADSGHKRSRADTLMHTSNIKTLKLVKPYERYIACSYPWDPSPGEDDTGGGYRIQPGNTQVNCLRNVVLDRFTHYARYIADQKKVRLSAIPFWIDQLSIMQTDPIEKEHAMQAMDLVYKDCSHAVGYLWAQIETQEDLDLLGRLLRGDIVSEGRTKQLQLPMLQKHVDKEIADKILRLIVALTDDRWWKRAWIFQEDYNAGPRMQLLIRHAPGLLRQRVESQIGRLPGEVVVDSTTFRKFVTLFCIAYPQTFCPNSMSEDCSAVLRRAGKYNMIHKYGTAAGDKSGKPISSQVFRDLGMREMKERSDMLAISANCLEYAIRINTLTSIKSGQSISLSMLTLCLMNGEIINNGKNLPDPSETVVDFLETQSMPINVSFDQGALTFMKHCRFSFPRLSSDGIHTKGMLWKLGRKVHIDIPKGHSQSAFGSRYKKGLDKCGRSRLNVIARTLHSMGYKESSGSIQQYLEDDRNFPSRRDKWSSKNYMEIMAIEILAGIDAGKPLRLGLTVDSKGEVEGSHHGIFVGDFARNAFVFTQWKGTQEYMDEENLSRTLAKYVSLEVERDGHLRDECERIRTKRWANGLCFFDGVPRREFVFPWPEALKI